jgi:Putative hemolysin
MKLIQADDLVKAARLEKLGGRNTAQVLMSLLQLDKINDLYARHYQKDQANFVSDVLHDAGIKYQISDKALQNIPKSGGFILISNHPFGGIEGLILLDTVTRIRPDFKIMANFLFNWVDPIKDRFFSVNPFETRKDVHSSYNGLKQAMAHVTNGHGLAIFPAGEVSTYQPGSNAITDKNWNLSIIKFLKNAGVPIVPAYFHGTNSWFFHALGRVHPLLRTVKIPSELLNKQNETVSIQIGSAISVKHQMEITDISSFGRYLRARVYGLSNRTDNVAPTHFQSTKKAKPIASPVSPQSLFLEIANISPYYQLFEWQHYEVFCAPSFVIPNITQEIGRLREITFRNVGEGTNESTDIDEFDKHYHQLFIWDNKMQQIAGGYRIGKGRDIIKQYGLPGFYTNTLFKMEQEMAQILKQSIELGRSFVTKEYQRKPLSLFLLWKGILHLLWKNPEYNYLVGPVSISNNYSALSKEIMIRYVQKHHADHSLEKFLKPRYPFVSKTSITDTSVLLEHTGNLQQLDLLIRELDPDNDRMPVLLRKYLELGGNIASFNIDPEFNNVVDGFLVLDLDRVKPEMIHALAGKQNAGPIL